MSDPMKATRAIVSSLLLLTTGTAPVFAENYALLVGVGKYPYCEKLRKQDGTYGINLDGPRFDAEALRSILISRFHYSENRIVMLLDEKATHQAILDGIDTLVRTVKTGDHVLIYYSGHGTSNYSDGGFGMDPATGAVVPSDIRLDQPAPKVLEQLIVGKRDLRPRLTEMEKKATVVVIFDACFSGESVKSIPLSTMTQARYIDLGFLTGSQSKAVVSTRATTPLGEYPYKRVVYLSAAANNETAGDMSSKVVVALKGKYPLFDANPHGVFTSALLVSLHEPSRGTNCPALMKDIRGQLAAFVNITKWTPQHPQHLFAESDPEVDRICIEHLASAAPTPTPGPGPSPTNDIRASLDQLAAEATAKLNCQADKSSYRNGEKTVLTCDAPEDGHIAVFSYGMGDGKAMVLLPNRYDEGVVKAGKIQIPAVNSNTRRGWSIMNGLPKGARQQEQVMLVLFSADALDTKNLAPAGTFADLPKKDMPSVRSQYISAGYNAIEMTFPIVQ